MQIFPILFWIEYIATFKKNLAPGGTHENKNIAEHFFDKLNINTYGIYFIQIGHIIIQQYFCL